MLRNSFDIYSTFHYKILSTQIAKIFGGKIDTMEKAEFKVHSFLAPCLKTLQHQKKDHYRFHSTSPPCLELALFPRLVSSGFMEFAKACQPKRYGKIKLKAELRTANSALVTGM